MHFTNQSIRNFAAPPNGTQTYWDSTTRGFGLRVSAQGTKTFMVLIGSGRRQSLGRYPQVKLTDARTAAKQILAEKQLGKIKPTHTAFADAVTDYLAEAETKNKPRTVSDYRRILSRHFDFGRRSIADITPHDISKVLSGLKRTPSERHHAYAGGRAFFRWAFRSNLIHANPFERLQIHSPKPRRERTLSPQELAKVLDLAQDMRIPFHAILSLLALTGQRRGEIAALEWDWIDEAARTITLPAPVTKNGREHIFPIGNRSLSVLSNIPRKAGPYLFPAARDRYTDRPATVFNGWGKPKATFDDLLQIPPWTLHDLRRTFRTAWAELGIPIEVAERYINHVSGVHSGVQAIYNRHSYLPEMRIAVEKWECYLENILGK